MKYEDTVRSLERWQAAQSGRTADLRLTRVGEWVVTLWKDGFIVSSAADMFLDAAITKALASWLLE